MKISDDTLGLIKRRSARDELPNDVDATIAIYDYSDCEGLTTITLGAGGGYDYEAAELSPEQARALAAELLAAADLFEQWQKGTAPVTSNP